MGLNFQVICHATSEAVSGSWSHPSLTPDTLLLLLQAPFATADEVVKIVDDWAGSEGVLPLQSQWGQTGGLSWAGVP